MYVSVSRISIVNFIGEGLSYKGVILPSMRVVYEYSKPEVECSYEECALAAYVHAISCGLTVPVVMCMHEPADVITSNNDFMNRLSERIERIMSESNRPEYMVISPYISDTLEYTPLFDHTFEGDIVTWAGSPIECGFFFSKGGYVRPISGPNEIFAVDGEDFHVLDEAKNKSMRTLLDILD
jgi:hypothetical protein